MIKYLTDFVEYLRKIPASFLVVIVVGLILILYLPEEHAKIVSVDGFRNENREFLGLGLLCMILVCVARLSTFIGQWFLKIITLNKRQKSLHKLTPEEKGYLIPYIKEQKASIYVGIDDGIMSGLRARDITYNPTNAGDLLNGIAFNLQPWAREYLNNHQDLLSGYVGQPLTPRQKFRAR